MLSRLEHQHQYKDVLGTVLIKVTSAGKPAKCGSGP